MVLTWACRVLLALGMCALVALGPAGTSWAATPTPVASDSPTPTDSPTVAPDTGTCAAPSDTCTSTVRLASDQYLTLAFGLGLIVFLGGAAVVGSWRS